MLEVKRPVRSLLHHPVQRHTERDDEVPAEVWVGGREERGEIKRKRETETDLRPYLRSYQRLHTLRREDKNSREVKSSQGHTRSSRSSTGQNRDQQGELEKHKKERSSSQCLCPSAAMSRVLILSVLLLSLSWCRCAVITGVSLTNHLAGFILIVLFNDVLIELIIYLCNYT